MVGDRCSSLTDNKFVFRRVNAVINTSDSPHLSKYLTDFWGCDEVSVRPQHVILHIITLREEIEGLFVAFQNKSNRE